MSAENINMLKEISCMSESVIVGGLEANQNDVNQTLADLLNVGSDEDAVNIFRERGRTVLIARAAELKKAQEDLAQKALQLKAYEVDKKAQMGIIASQIIDGRRGREHLEKELVVPGISPEFKQELEAKLQMQIESNQVVMDNALKNQNELKALVAEREQVKKLTENCMISLDKEAEKLNIEVKVIGVEPGPGDYITFCQTSDAETTYTNKVMTGDQANFTTSVPIPKPGYYEVRYFWAGSKKPLSTSFTVIVGPELSFEATYLEESKEIELKYKLLAGVLSSGDWVGFYAKSKGNKAYIEYFKVQPDQPEATKRIKAPTRPGEYEFRFFPGSTGYSQLGSSNVIVVPNPNRLTVVPQLDSNGVAVTYKITPTIVTLSTSHWFARDWVGIYQVGGATYSSYVYVNNKLGYVEMDAPRKPGMYYIAYNSAEQKDEPAVVSEPFEIRNHDSLQAKFQDAFLRINWKLYTVAEHAKDFITVVDRTVNPDKEIYNTYCDHRKHWATMSNPKPDMTHEYEIRYHSYLVGTSKPYKTAIVDKL